MKKLFTFLTLIFFTAFVICCDDDVSNFDPSKDPVEGKVAGKAWTFASGNASYTFFSGDYSGKLLAEDLKDPCAVVVTNEAHISVTFPPQRGNFNLPYISHSGNTADVVFHVQGGANRYTATSGFLEIVDITSTEIVGFISADYDDNNHVEGAFLLRVCN